MKKQLFCIAFLLFFSGSSALAASTLLSVTKTHSRESTQIYFTFDKLPVYSIDNRERRLDIALDQTRLASGLTFFAADTRIVKILPITNNDRTVISLFFRHKPQDIKTEKNSDGKLIIDILIGSQVNQADQLVTKQLKDLTTLDGKSAQSTNPLQDSPYAANWLSFFSNYESQISYTVPVQFSIPPFPIINLMPPLLAGNGQILPPELNELASKGLWQETEPILRDLQNNNKDPEQQKLIALTMGEMLLRKGTFNEAEKQLSLLVKEHPDEPVGIFARFLLLLLRAQHLANYSANPEFAEMETLLGPTNPLFPHLILFEIESALAGRQFKKAQILLNRQDVAYSPDTQKIKDLRQADTYVGLQQPLKAYVAYHLLKNQELIHSYRDSLKGYCDTVYFHKKYQEAGECYARLIPIIEEKEASGLISFRKAMADLKANPRTPNDDAFSLVEEAFSGTEAGYRATLKKTDLKYLQDPDWGEEALRAYQELAQKAVMRPLVAEALLKEALVYKQLNKNNLAIRSLMQLLREFRTGEFRLTAQALLIDLLPKEINSLIGEGKFPEALILAKENKEIFQKNWLDITILSDLAFSYRKIGLFNHAREIYLYIMDIVKIDQREQYYLPLLETVKQQGDLKFAEHLAGRYANTYPQGKDREKVLIIRLNALIQEGQLDKAQGLLPSPLPENDALQTIAAAISFGKDNYSETLGYINRVSKETRATSSDLLFMQAESLYQTGDSAGAEKIFREIQESTPYFDQTSYRLAQLETKRGNIENALKLYRQIVDKGKSPLWKQYAAKDLEYLESTERLRQKLE